MNVGQICEAAGIAKGSFYRYFDSKHDIFLAAALSTVDAVGEGLDTLSEPMSETKAVAELATLLKPFVPLYLEIMTRELRGEKPTSPVSPRGSPRESPDGCRPICGPRATPP